MDENTRQTTDTAGFKHQSSTTVFLRATHTETITLDKLLILMGSNISHQQQSF